MYSYTTHSLAHDMHCTLTCVSTHKNPPRQLAGSYMILYILCSCSYVCIQYIHTYVYNQLRRYRMYPTCTCSAGEEHVQLLISRFGNHTQSIFALCSSLFAAGTVQQMCRPLPHVHAIACTLLVR